MKAIEFMKQSEAITVHKENGTSVNYYVFDEFEIHTNIMKPHSVQEWHYHSRIEEVLLITKGSILCKWIEDNKKQQQVVNEQELIRVKNSVHTLENTTDQEVEFTVFRFVPDGHSKADIIKNDKYVVEQTG